MCLKIISETQSLVKANLSWKNICCTCPNNACLLAGHTLSAVSVSYIEELEFHLVEGCITFKLVFMFSFVLICVSF